MKKLYLIIIALVMMVAAKAQWVSGQILNIKSLNELNKGVYIIKGVTKSGKTTVNKIIKN